LTLFGKGTGKVSAIAKGARKPRSRTRGTVQLFNHGDYLLYKGKNFYTVTQCETKNPFSALRENVVKFAYASYVSELLREVLPENEINPSVFTLSTTVLNMLTAGSEEMTARAFDCKLLQLAGYGPQLKYCVTCGRNTFSRVFFSPSEGGTVCASCLPGHSVIPLEKSTLAVLQHLMQVSPQRAVRLKVSDYDLELLENLFTSYWEYILEKKLKSTEFIRRARGFA